MRYMDIKTRLQLYLWSNLIERRHTEPMHIHRYGRRIHWILPFLKRRLRTGGYPNNFPVTDKQNIGTQTPSLARRFHTCNQRNDRKKTKRK